MAANPNLSGKKDEVMLTKWKKSRSNIFSKRHLFTFKLKTIYLGPPCFWEKYLESVLKVDDILIFENIINQNTLHGEHGLVFGRFYLN